MEVWLAQLGSDSRLVARGAISLIEGVWQLADHTTKSTVFWSCRRRVKTVYT